MGVVVPAETVIAEGHGGDDGQYGQDRHGDAVGKIFSRPHALHR